ncbi:SNF2 family N-terminal domain-containing protein [Mycena amicta]|nr:SNF2 family N-terminal domain-containing protein [Mycena amicta]
MEDDTGSAPRRSNRRRKAFKVPLDRSASYEPEEDEEGSDGYDSAPKPKRVDSLDCDYNPDADTAALRYHRNKCEKCNGAPAHEQLEAERKRSKNKSRRRKSTEDEFEESGDEMERISKKGGWVRCLKCPVAVHWGCLASTQRDEILKAVREVDRAAWRSTQPETELQDENGQPKVHAQKAVSAWVVWRPPWSLTFSQRAADAPSTDVEMKVALKYDSFTALLFRCLVCKRLAHYEHLPVPPECHPEGPIGDIAGPLYFLLVVSRLLFLLNLLWNRTKYHITRRLSLENISSNGWADLFGGHKWVPHMWLVSTNHAKLKNFLATGPKVELLEQPVGESEKASAEKYSIPSRRRLETVVNQAGQQSLRPGRQPDRVMDIVLWRPRKTNKKKQKGKGKAMARIESDEDDDMDEEAEMERAAVLDGLEPSSVFSESLDEWESRTRDKFTMEHIDQVAWAFFKWNELTYDEATWDSPPLPDSPGYAAFSTALERFIAARDVWIPEGTKTRMPDRAKEGYSSHRLKQAEDLSLGQDPAFKLMDFQVDGFNWLCDNWWNGQQCILADEMGLGKTVQIATFIGKIIQDFGVSPALVVVPNSTITNWVREFERWAPKLRVVPFYGEAKSRAIIKEFELLHKGKRKGYMSIKYHVLVTTYDTLIGRDFSTVFKSLPRWEVLVVDEGQRLKSDASLLFRKLNELRTLHRVIMTGTPLNNNIRELFNLLSFLDSATWNDLESLAKIHEELTEDLIKDLHVRLRPYFLRRIKSQVLKLPPKNEVIVPVSMAPLQKEIYRSILTHNLDLLKGLLTKKAGSKGKLNNVLMHLRKCLQHPYLYEDTIEPRGLTQQETHAKLIDASAKLRFLKVLLPKLKARGHRVLLFSQFVIALDIIEDFLNGEDLRYLRLDGNTKGSDRQKGMDEFNREGSDVFIYLLTTRAGGVGINLFTADTVIIFDPDFNPHQDLQAIARAYRYGQKNTCLVFKLMVKDSAEERIIQVGKKKLVLDHLIVQKMDDDEEGGDNVESILTFGAQNLFAEDAEARNIVYSDQDIDKLIEKTEQEAEPEQAGGDGGAFSFTFAKVWAAEKDTLEEALQKMNENREQNQIQELDRYGRGKQRAAATRKQNAYLVDESPVKSRSRAQSLGDNDSAYASEIGHSSDSDDSDNGDAASLVAEALNQISEQPPRKRKKKTGLLASTGIQNTTPAAEPPCSLCGLRHPNQLGACLMTENSEHLAEFREMLILHPDDEPLDKRLAAVAAIDEILYQRGHVHLVHGQPLEIVNHGTTLSDVPAKKAKVRADVSITPSAPVASSSSARVFPKRHGELLKTDSITHSGEWQPLQEGSPDIGR